MLIDYTIRIGDCLTALTMVIGGILVVSSMRGDLKKHGEAVAALQTEVSELRKVVIAQARTEERLNAYEKRLEALER
jgi:hypothetical protein